MTVELPWGQKVTGTLVVECDECKTKWQLVIVNTTLSEGLGAHCPKCNKVTTNWVRSMVAKNALERWF